MVFSSLVFLFQFFPAVLILYYILPKRAKNLCLLISSILFYAWGEPKYVFVLIISIILNYILGILIVNNKKNKSSKRIMILSVCVNILVLCLFKYSHMMVQLFESITSDKVDFIGIAMPLGISFYTFQSISYIVDVYRGIANVQKNIISFGMYISMFPKLIAGPVVRYSTIEAEITHRNENLDQIIQNLSYGIRRFVIGLSKKVLFANSIGIIWKSISQGNLLTLPATMAWVGVLAYSFQIYFDFSGYSDMAIGLARMFGFQLEENFNYPYISKSITEFWKRWHISIGSWFKDYVYIPLGGNRKGKLRHFTNIIIVWILTGLWHGANLNFLLWGTYFGVIIILEKLLNRILKRLPNMIRHLYSFVLICFGWMIFALDRIRDVKLYARALFGFNGWGFNTKDITYLFHTQFLFFIILIVASTPFVSTVCMKIQNKLYKKRNGIYIVTLLQNIIFILLMIVSVAYLVNESYNPFLYLRF